MNRTSIINNLIKKNNYRSYLEIGVQHGLNFINIKCNHKIGVDPDVNSAATVFIESDKFFKDNKETFDIIFIDGLHLKEQFKKDIENSVKILNEDGIIVCHDCLPLTKHDQIREYDGGSAWTGDVWKGWVELRCLRDDLEMYVVNCDWGCGIIKKGQQTLINVSSEELHWDNFCKYKNEWMNIISVESYLKGEQI